MAEHLAYGFNGYAVSQRNGGRKRMAGTMVSQVFLFLDGTFFGNGFEIRVRF